MRTITATSRGTVIEGCNPTEAQYQEYKKEYVESKCNLNDLRLKHNLSKKIATEFNQRLAKELNVHLHGGGRNHKYNFIDNTKIQYRKKAKRKQFYMKYKGRTVSGLGGFIEPITIEIIYSIFNEEL